jgi:hypothetical protein
MRPQPIAGWSGIHLSPHLLGRVWSRLARAKNKTLSTTTTTKKIRAKKLEHDSSGRELGWQE